jgi:regulator of protease activity HflC (stomatin/prohibitin superfamily)
MERKMKRSVLRISVFFFFGLILLMFSLYIVPAGSVGVVTRFGAVNRVAYPGLGIKIPLVEWVVRMDVRTQKDEIDSSAASKDLQVVTSTIAVNYHLDGKYAVNVYQNIGSRYQDIVIAPAIQNVFKATTAKFTAEQLITNREAVRIQAEGELAKQLLQYHVIVENFNHRSQAGRPAAGRDGQAAPGSSPGGCPDGACRGQGTGGCPGHLELFRGIN